MDKNTFNEQINRLVIEYSDKGFNMSKERAIQWYEALSSYTDLSLRMAISEVLMTCSYAPTIADIYKTQRLQRKTVKHDVIVKKEQ